MRIFAALVLAGAAAWAATGGALADGYPRRGKAIDHAEPASSYADLLAQRPRALAIFRTRGHGFAPAPAVHEYVNGVLARIVAVSPAPDLDVQARVLASPEFQAVAAPDGTIFVSLGLLQQIDSEDELAFVLGHEFSHVFYRHHDSDWFGETQHDAIGAAVNYRDLTSGSGLGGVRVSGGGLPDIGRELDIAARVYRVSETVIAPHWSQEDEDEADALGFDLMVRAGYNPEAATVVLERIAQFEALAEEEFERIEAEAPKRGGGAASAIGELLGAAVSGRPVDGMKVALGVTDFALDELEGEIRPHRPAPERLDALSGYRFREYRGEAPEYMTALPWRGSSEAGRDERLRALFEHYAMADLMLDYAEGGIGTADQARISRARALAEPTASHPYTRYAGARVNAKLGDEHHAEADLEAARASEEPSWIVYSALIRARMERGDLAGAQALMDEAVLRFDDSPVLLPLRIEVLRAQGRQREAEALLPRCRKYDVRELEASCRKAAGKS